MHPRRMLSGVITLSLLGAGLAVLPEVAATAAPRGADEVVPSSPLVPVTLPAPDEGPRFSPAPVRWPAPGRGVLSVPRPGAAAVGLASTVVSVVPPGAVAGLTKTQSPPTAGAVPVDGGSPPAWSKVTGLSPAVPEQVEVEVVDQTVVRGFGGVGLGFTVRASESDVSGPVGVQLDVSGFQGAVGGGFANRLRLVRVPQCAVDLVTGVWVDPLPPGCPATREVVASSVDPVKGVLLADVWADGAPAKASVALGSPAAPSAAAGGSVYTLSASTSGQEGTYAATPLGVAGSWSTGTQSGSFEYSYPLPMAAAITGDAPSLALSYSSGSVDGMTAGDNAQSSVVGLGWGLEAPYIQRSVNSCDDDGHAGLADWCWGDVSYRIVMNGHASVLVEDLAASNSTRAIYRLRDDPGWRVELWSSGSSANGDNDGEFWKVITTDGTTFSFGKHSVDSGSDPTTDSVWTAPIFGDDSGEPCFDAIFADSWCQQAWRWNLDWVVDLHGNQQAWFYTGETNAYRMRGAVDQSYVRAGLLRRIEYSTRWDGSHGQSHRSQVTFSYESRCSERAIGDIPNSATPPCPSPADSPSSFPDVPVDLMCDAGQGCTEAAMSFFTRYLLRRVETSVADGGVLGVVDRVELGYWFPDPGDGTSPALWLSRIRRSGVVGTNVTSVPDVTFGGTLMDNRVDYNLALGVAQLRKRRVTSVVDELGGITSVTYGQDGLGCTAATLPTPPSWDTNTKLCFPRFWKPDAGPAGFGVFHKYVVEQVTRVNSFPVSGSGGSVGSADQTTAFTYVGSPAWAYDDGPAASTSTQSWGDWRGYQTVDTRSMSDAAYRGGSTRALGRQRQVFYRGMHGDPLANGGSKSEVVTDSSGGQVPDYPYYRGRVRESLSYRLDASGSTTATDGISLTAYTSARVTQAGATSDSRHDSHLVVPAGRIDRKLGTSTGSNVYRSVSLAWTYDVYGRELSEERTGDVLATCRTTAYAGDVAARGANKLDFPSQLTTEAGVCGATNPTLLARTLNYYDSQTGTVNLPITLGELTKTVASTGTNDPTPTTSFAYDSYGRPIQVTDGRSNTTSTAYSNASTSPLTVTVTNAAGHRVVTELDPRRLAASAVKDPNNLWTTSTFDALGRLLSVTLPSSSASPPPTYLFSYYLYSAKDRPAKVRTQRLRSGSSDYLSTWSFFDALGQPRQTQAVSPNGTDLTVLVNTRFDERGNREAVSQPVATAATAGEGMRDVQGAYLNEEQTTFDALAQPTVNKFVGHGALQWTATTTYDGDRTTSVPPSPMPAVQMTMDVLGRVVTRTEGTGTATPATTSYTYDRLGRVQTITDPASHVTSYTYDRVSRVISSTDPDAGTTTTSYDANGNQQSVTTPMGTVATAYDDLDRPKTITQGATALASYTYDTATLGKGKPATSTTTVDGRAYTQTVTGYTRHGQATGATYSFPAEGNAPAATYTMSATFDGGDRPSTVTYPGAGALSSETVTTTYNTVSSPERLTSDLGTPASYVTGTSYFNNGALESRTLNASTNAGATPLTRAYTWETNTQRLATVRTTLGSTLIEDDSYTWYAGGPLWKVLSAAVPGRNAFASCTTYDALARLKHAWTAPSGCTDAVTSVGSEPGAFNRSWTYAADGNIQSVRDGASTTNYTYGSATHPHAVTAVGAASFAYDAGGHQKSRTRAGTTSNLTWDVLGRLTQSDGVGGNASYVDGIDRTRLSRTIGSTTTRYLPGQEIDYVAGAVTAVRRYYSIGGTTVAVRTVTAASNTLTWQVNDRQGSVALQVTEGTGTLSRAYTDPYGLPRTGAGVLATDRGWLQSTADPTGLTDLGARYYDPALGRFLSPDPLNVQVTAQSANAYAYADNNPVSFSDPSGLVRQEENVVGVRSETQQLQIDTQGILTTPSPGGLTTDQQVGRAWLTHLTAEHHEDPRCLGPCRYPSQEEIDRAWANTKSWDELSTGERWVWGALAAVVAGAACVIACTVEGVVAVGIGAADFAAGGSLTAGGALVGSGAIATSMLRRTMAATELDGAAGVAANAVTEAWSVDALSASGSRLVGKDLTRAGQELAKHAGQGGFPVPKGSPSVISRTGQEQLDDILTYPGTRIEDITKGNFAGGKYYIAPDGRGAAFDSSGVFQYFGVFGP